MTSISKSYIISTAIGEYATNSDNMALVASIPQLGPLVLQSIPDFEARSPIQNDANRNKINGWTLGTYKISSCVCGRLNTGAGLGTHSINTTDPNIGYPRELSPTLLRILEGFTIGPMEVFLKISGSNT